MNNKKKTFHSRKGKKQKAEKKIKPKAEGSS